MKLDRDPEQQVLAAVHKQDAQQLVRAIARAVSYASDFSHT